MTFFHLFSSWKSSWRFTTITAVSIETVVILLVVCVFEFLHCLMLCVGERWNEHHLSPIENCRLELPNWTDRVMKMFIKPRDFNHLVSSNITENIWLKKMSFTSQKCWLMKSIKFSYFVMKSLKIQTIIIFENKTMFWFINLLIIHLMLSK